MRIVCLSANKLGQEIIREAVSLKDTNISVTDILTLNPEAKTIMYDRVPLESWYDLSLNIHLINRIETEGKEVLKKLEPDIVLMSGWRQIVPKDVLDIPKYGFFNFHPTLLPYGRGSAPIINQILRGVINSGLTMHYAIEGLDAGDIVGQEQFTIFSDDHAEEVYDKAIIAGKHLIRDYLPLIVKGIAPRIKQDESQAVIFTPPRGINSINQEDNIDRVYAKIRAVSHPYKGAYIKDNRNKIILWRAKRVNSLENPIIISAEDNLENILEDVSEFALQGRLYFESQGNFLKITEAEVANG